MAGRWRLALALVISLGRTALLSRGVMAECAGNSRVAGNERAPRLACELA